MGTMLLENSRWRKFSQLVPNHVFRHEDGVKNLAVMDKESVPNKLGRNHRAAGPCLDGLLDARSIHLVYFLKQMSVNERTFFQGTTHSVIGW